MLICIPVGAIVGSSMGGITAASAKDIKAAHSALSEGRILTDIPQQLHQAMVAYAQDNELRVVDVTARKMAETDEGTVTSSPPSTKAVDTIIEVTPAKLIAKSTGEKPLKMGISLSATIRVLRARDRQVLDSFTYTSHLPKLTPAELVADNYRGLNEEMAFAYGDMAAQVIDELLLIYHPPEILQKVSVLMAAETSNTPERITDAEPRNPNIPATVLQPLYPEYSKKSCFGLDFIAMLCSADANSVTPTLAWEPMPAIFEASGYAGRITDISYEVKLYEAAKRSKGGIYERGSLIYSRKGFPEPRHRIEMVLQPCSYYFWTVRMRFTLDGQSHVTEWMGAYNALGGDIQPWHWRRSTFPSYYLTSTPSDHYSDFFLPFRTPCPDENRQ